MFHIADEVEALGVAFGVAGYAYAEILGGLLGADVRDQAVGVAEAALGGDEVGLTGLGIAAESQDIVDAGVPEIVENFAEFVGGVAYAGEMGHGADFELVLDAGDEIE